jgi:ankyrin repeat protein
VKLLLAHEKILINQKGQRDITALLAAIDNGHIEIAKLLLARNDIQANEKSANNPPALRFAIEK